jgi:hypothetical protein
MSRLMCALSGVTYVVDSDTVGRAKPPRLCPRCRRGLRRLPPGGLVPARCSAQVAHASELCAVWWEAGGPRVRIMADVASGLCPTLGIVGCGRPC